MAQQTNQNPDQPRGRSAMAGRSTPGGHPQHTLSIPVIAMRGMGRIYDIQLAAARLFLQTQASAACAFGWPDSSGLFRVADERARRVFSSGTEQLLSLAEQAVQTSSEVQRQVGRMLESQAVTEAEQWQRGMEELGRQAEESLEEFKALARQQAEESIRAAETLSEESREAFLEGSEQLHQSLRQGMEQGRAATRTNQGGRGATARGDSGEPGADEEDAMQPARGGRAGGQESAAARRRSHH